MAQALLEDLAEQFLTFMVSGQSLSLPAGDVAEIIRPRAMTRLPHSPKSLLGVTNFRGSALPVVSLAHLLGRHAVSLTRSARVVVVDNGTSLGLLVDEISSLERTSESRRIDLVSLLAGDFGAMTRRSTANRAAAPRPSEPQGRTQPNVALICFGLAGQEYAMPVEHVVEVTTLPAQITEVPGTDQAMLGMTQLRNALVPLVSLRVLLGLTSEKFDQTKARIVVIRLGGALVGLVTDGIRAIIRVAADTLDPVPPVLTRGSGEARVEAICRLDGGRLISILARDKLFDAQTSGRIVAECANGTDVMTDHLYQRDEEQFVIFQLGTESYGLPIASVDQIVRRPAKLTRVPRAPAFVEGVMSLRGKMVPVIDQRQRFAVEGQNDVLGRKVIVVTIDGQQTGFVVDKVSEILAVSQAELRGAPALEAAETPVIDRIAMLERDGRMILLLDPKALLDRAERDVMANLSVDVNDAEVL